MGAPEPTEEEAKAMIDKIYKAISHANDQVAQEGGFLTGDHMTIADVSLYSVCLLVILVLSLDTAEYESFEEWRTAMGEDEVIQELDKGMLRRLKG